jgi:WD40 repeat protein
MMPERIGAWRFAPDSRSIITLNIDRKVQRWRAPDYDQGESILEFPDDFNWLAAAISPDSHWLAIRRDDGTIEIWDLTRRELIRRLPTTTERPWRYFAGGKRLVCLEPGTDRMQVWDLDSGAQVETWKRAVLLDEDYQQGAISPDGRWCFTIGFNTPGLLRDIRRGQDIDFPMDMKSPNNLAFSAEGSQLAVTTCTGGVFTNVWDVDQRRVLATLENGGHSVAFAPNGRRLAIGASWAQAVQIWDLEGRRQLVTLPGTGSIFWSVTFSPDGNIIGSQNARQELFLWQAPSWNDLERQAQVKEARDRHL